MISSSRGAVAAGLIFVITGCGESGPSATPPATSTNTPRSFDPDGCPVADQEACALAVDVAGALVAGDADMITRLSRTAEFACDEVDLPLPDCAPGSVIVGHPVIDSRPMIDVLDSATYAAHNRRLLADVDPTYSDEHGGGAVQVLGVGTCGPDIPERRSYHLAFTAAAASADGTDRLVGSYELNLLDDEWLIGTAFLDTYDAWLDTYPEPLKQHGCNPVPWR